MWVEKNGVFGNSERRTQQWFRMVDPPGQARDDVWQTLAVARRLFELDHPGLKDSDGRFLFHLEDEEGNAVPYWQWDHWHDLNVDRELYEEYRPLTFKKHKHVASYEALVEARGLRWPVVETEDGPKETRWRFAEGFDPFVEEGTGFDFYHSTTNDGRAQIWFHPYYPAAEVTDEEYPFLLVTGRVLEHWHTGTMTMRIPPLRKAMPGAYLEMHPADARVLGLGNGDHARITTRRGSIELPVWFNGRGHPPTGQVFVPFYDERSPINELTLDAYDPYSKQPDYKKSAAKITPIDGRRPR